MNSNSPDKFHRRLRAIAKPQYHEKHFGELYDFAPTGHLTFSNDGRVEELNHKVAHYLGLSRIEIRNRNFIDFVKPSDAASFNQHLREACLSASPVTVSLQLIKSDGTLLDVELESIGWHENMRNEPVVRSCMHDIGARKAAEKELKETRDRALAATQAKSNFLANMSHEMRTPLGVIIGFTDLLREDPSSIDVKQGLETIHRNGIHLLNLVDDLLDLAKIEAGQMTMELEPFDLKEEMQVLINQFAARAHEKDINLKLDFLMPLPDHIQTDPIRFRQILLNLLSNALKFTRFGFIRVEVSMVGGLLCIDVIDTGDGICPEEASSLFQPFKQLHNTPDKRIGGTGLGLCLSRGLAEALGGGLVLLASEKGKGSTFRMTIDLGLTSLEKQEEPLQAEEAPQGLFRELPSLDGIKILVVEDGIDNQFLIKKLLETIGAEVECAEDGEQAVKAVLQGTYDIVLMDLQLPVMDGFMATTELRRSGRNLPIIALTAHALVEDRMKAQALGFNDFISKPIDWFKLTEAIIRSHDLVPVLH